MASERPAHVPKFGNWDPNNHVPYTAVFDHARAGKGAKFINPNDPAENGALFGRAPRLDNVNQDAVGTDEMDFKPASRHQRRASRGGEESKIGANLQEGVQKPVARQRRHPSRGEGESLVRTEGDAAGRQMGTPKRDAPQKGSDGGGSGADRVYASFGAGFSPVHSQGRPGKKLGSASPATELATPGTPNRTLPEKHPAPLPKFGDWDVNNPASGDGFTVIFNKARNEKKMGGGALHIPPMQGESSPLKQEVVYVQESQPAAQAENSNWLCCCFHPSAVK